MSLLGICLHRRKKCWISQSEWILRILGWNWYEIRVCFCSSSCCTCWFLVDPYIQFQCIVEELGWPTETRLNTCIAEETIQCLIVGCWFWRSPAALSAEIALSCKYGTTITSSLVVSEHLSEKATCMRIHLRSPMISGRWVLKSVVKLGTGKLLAGSGMVVQLCGNVQENCGISGGEGCCCSRDLSKDSWNVWGLSMAHLGWGLPSSADARECVQRSLILKHAWQPTLLYVVD